MMTMEELLNKMDNNAYTRHISVHDEKGNKKHWKETCNRLNKRMNDLEGWCDKEDFESYVEYKENHKEN